MRLDGLKRWQWIIIGVFVGMLIGFTRDLAFNEMDSQNVESMELSRFNSLINEPAVKGMPIVKDITVVRQKDGAYGVFLQYMNLGTQDVRSGRKRPEYKLQWLQPTDKQLKAALERLNKQKTATQAKQSEGFMGVLRKVAEAVRMKPADPPGTVLDYMQRVTDNKGNHVAFAYAWWRQPRVMILSWMLLGLVAIGGVWPFIVNLIAFGSLWRPKEEKEVDLRKVKNTTKAEYRPKNVVTEKDMDELKRLEMELEAKVKAGGVEITPPPPPLPDQPKTTAPAQLTATKLETAQIDEKAEDKHYDRRAGDFYPVERHVKKEGEEEEK